MDPYQNLANAIVLQAVRDYRSALRRLRKNPQNREAKEERDSLLRFFHSRWYHREIGKGGTVMDAKTYLMQVVNIDQQINSKLEQLGRLRALATHTTSTFSDMPKSHNNNSRLEDTVLKIIEMEHSIDDEIDKLVDLKAEVRQQISLLPDARCRLILEEKYLNGETWEGIAADLGYTVRNVQILHGKALQEFQVPERVKTA